MRFTTLSVERFGPYYAPQSIEFGKKKRVVLVHGANMRGKTSILNAIRWALYGRALDRFGEPMPLTKLVNLDASRGGDWTMNVSLGIEVDGATYSVTRTAQPRDSTATPHADDDFDVTVFVKRGNILLKPDDGQREINRMLPEQISRFSLFDGELLNDYEALLADPNEQSQVIKESIEHILGVPALTNAIADLRIGLKDAGKRQRALAKRDADANSYADAANEIEAEIDEAERDLAGLRERHASLTRSVAELDERLRQNAFAEADVQRRQGVVERLSALERESEALEADLLQKSAHAWKDIISRAIAERVRTLDQQREEQIRSLQGTARLTEKLSRVESALAGTTCPTCGQSLPSERIAEIAAERDQIRTELAASGTDATALDRTGASLQRLRSIRSENVLPAIGEIERRRRAISVDIADLEQIRRELDERLAGHDQTAIARNRREFIDLTKDLGVIEESIAARQKLIDTKQVDAKRYRALIGKVGGPALDRLNREVQIFDELIALFQAALVALRDELRLGVESEAASIFRQLTTNKTYSGLQINDFYGLSILDADKLPVPVRSAGAEQVVALALVGALNRNAVRRGPVVIDTPFGRLDPDHRANILKYLPKMAEQVTLLVHAGEVNRATDLEEILDVVDREYEIRFVSSTRSEIVPING